METMRPGPEAETGTAADDKVGVTRKMPSMGQLLYEYGGGRIFTQGNCPGERVGWETQGTLTPASGIGPTANKKADRHPVGLGWRGPRVCSTQATRSTMSGGGIGRLGARR